MLGPPDLRGYTALGGIGGKKGEWGGNPLEDKDYSLVLALCRHPQYAFYFVLTLNQDSSKLVHPSRPIISTGVVSWYES
jgi:hypothetical protein